MKKKNIGIICVLCGSAALLHPQQSNSPSLLYNTFMKHSQSIN